MKTPRPHSRKPAAQLANLSILLIGAAVYALASEPAFTAEDRWLRYESDNFITYSDASKKKTRRIVRELEFFAAALAHATHLSYPADAPKIRLVILRKNEDFDALDPHLYLGAFAVGNPAGVFFVINESNYRLTTVRYLKRSYVRTLFYFHDFRHPIWYETGLISLASTIEPRSRYSAYSIGQVPPTCLAFETNFREWSKLIAGDADEHLVAYTTPRQIWCKWYLYSLLLVHYVTLGDSFDNQVALRRYFASIQQGQASLEAFLASFETNPDDLRRNLQTYFRHLALYVVDFEHQDSTAGLSGSAADIEEVNLLLAEVERLSARRKLDPRIRQENGERDVPIQLPASIEPQESADVEASDPNDQETRQ